MLAGPTMFHNNYLHKENFEKINPRLGQYQINWEDDMRVYIFPFFTQPYQLCRPKFH